jgi:ribonuclease HII
LLLRSGEVVAGIDEVGRGALAGPVMVGVVLLRAWRIPPRGLNDSKVLSAARRRSLVEPIKAWADGWALGESSPTEIDSWGLTWALALAIDRALAALGGTPTVAIVDGPHNLLAPTPILGAPELRSPPVRVLTAVKGDRLYATVAAASVLAKVARDERMTRLGLEDDRFGWAVNKGYGTAVHRRALREHGPCDEHRRSWRLVDSDIDDMAKFA